ncbi:MULTISPECIES: helix-turn-helix domain-containing protein [unclassified Pseudomonas]|uniref:helix-turn-helix domain-containing protein n=1 Tax=unclassified Pseudomonas TaxID=196821 RepID=UPI00119C228C|nr:MULTISPECIES: helix-turn-helix transcriptional regulator [unclassified Pseudomonas]TWC60064.1 helix-turn-helix protein [Pseudomonas sp. SJZ080]
MSTFSERLRAARKTAGLSQERLGMEAGLEPASASARMNQYENGVHVPGKGTVQQIANALGLPAAYFYCDDDDEAELLKLFHSLKKDDRERVLSLAQQLAI